MEPVASVIERIKGFSASSVGFVKSALHRGSHSSHENPIEILKRLQREAFSDLMKLRDRQDKVERALSFFKSGKRNPFEEANTHIRGIIDVAGTLLFVKNDDQQAFDTLNVAGVGTGIASKFIFETTVRKKDTLIAELEATQNIIAEGDISGSPLALTKVMYLANISDFLSVASIPLGAQCSDFSFSPNISQGRRLVRFSPAVPSAFSQYYSFGAGLSAKGSNLSASVAELVSDPVGDSRWLSTFLQVNYRPFEEASLTFSGILKTRGLMTRLSKLGTLALPIRGLRGCTESDARDGSSSTGSFALMLESKFDESTGIGGWVEVKKLSPGSLRWGFSLSEAPEDEVGWGLRLGGEVNARVNQFQIEAFLNINVGKRGILQPGLVYATNGGSRVPALVFQSSWSM